VYFGHLVVCHVIRKGRRNQQIRETGQGAFPQHENSDEQHYNITALLMVLLLKPALALSNQDRGGGGTAAPPGGSGAHTVSAALLAG